MFKPDSVFLSVELVLTGLMLIGRLLASAVHANAARLLLGGGVARTELGWGLLGGWVAVNLFMVAVTGVWGLTHPRGVVLASEVSSTSHRPSGSGITYRKVGSPACPSRPAWRQSISTAASPSMPSGRSRSTSP